MSSARCFHRARVLFRRVYFHDRSARLGVILPPRPPQGLALCRPFGPRKVPHWRKFDLTFGVGACYGCNDARFHAFLRQVKETSCRRHGRKPTGYGPLIRSQALPAGLSPSPFSPISPSVLPAQLAEPDVCLGFGLIHSGVEGHTCCKPPFTDDAPRVYLVAGPLARSPTFGLASPTLRVRKHARRRHSRHPP